MASSSKNLHWLLRYGVPVVTVGIVAFLHYVFPWFAAPVHLVLFLPAVMLSAWYGGFWAGLLAIALSLATLNLITPAYFFTNIFDIHNPTDDVRLAIFILVSLFINYLTVQLNQAKMRAEESEMLLKANEHRLKQELERQEQLEASLKIALAEAEHASQVKSDFLANMSHEIRTPMNAVVGIANLLNMDGFSQQRKKELIKTLKLSAESLLELINNLLDIAKIESARIQLENAPYNLKELAEEVIAVLGVKAQEKGVALALDYRPELDTGFHGDRKRMRQILMNLISNAIKFTEKGGVTVKIFPWFNTASGKRETCIEVRDTGIGIPRDKLLSIFDQFSQADTSTTRKYGGTGLGLPITKMLVELMWGHISVESQPGRGSTFKVTLPAASHAGTKQVRSRAPEAKSATGITGESPRILLVEDYPSNVLVETTILGQLGCRYEVAQNGQEAIVKLDRNRFDIVLMDIQMPVMDGYEATRKIRRQEQEEGLPHIPIIGVTAYALREERGKCLSAGMDDYISKPFNPEDLEDKISTLMPRAPRPEAAA